MATSYRLTRSKSDCYVSVSGALTAIVVPEVKELLRKELEQETREIVFDLRDTTMLDSSGIGLLIASGNSIARKGGNVRVINAVEEIYELLSNMRLVARLNVQGPAANG